MARELIVRHFRQIVLWPLQLMPLRPGQQVQRHWEALQAQRVGNPWHELGDEFGGVELGHDGFEDFVADRG